MSVAKDDNISFLCPNGHKLNGPSKLQGRPGKCPHCGAKFEIPVLEENETFELAGSGPLAEVDVVPTIAIEEAEPEISFQLEEATVIESTSSIHSGINLPTGSNSTAALFEQLWREKNQGASIQLYLQDGEAYVPQWYAADLSQGTHGTFAAKSSDGYFTITSIAWSSIAQIVVEKVEVLPANFQ